MNFDGSRWSSREWIAAILAMALAMLTYIYVYVWTLKMDPDSFLTFLAVSATFLGLDLVLRKLIANKTESRSSLDRKG